MCKLAALEAAFMGALSLRRETDVFASANAQDFMKWRCSFRNPATTRCFAMSRVVDPSMLDALERVSRASRSSRRHDHAPYEAYAGCSLHSEQRSEHPRDPSVSRELRHGDVLSSPVGLFDRRWTGLLTHNFAMGFVSTVLPFSIYPFLTVYLNMEGTQVLSARALLSVPWALRLWFGCLIDCAPYFGRRTYILLGWVVCAGCLVASSLLTIPDPYFTDPSLVGTPLSRLSAQEQETVNRNAPHHGGIYAVLLFLATVGLVMADVAADGVVVQVMQESCSSESPDSHTSRLTLVLAVVRYGAVLMSFAFMGFGLNGVAYGGDFELTLTYNQVMLVAAVISSCPVLLSSFTLREISTRRRSVHDWLQPVTNLLENGILQRVVVCRFASGVLAGISATPVNPIAFYWAQVQPLNDNLVSFAAVLVVLAALRLTDNKNWNINYRLLIVGVTVVVLVVDCGATMFTIWDVVRSQYVWIGLPVMEALPSALDYVILTEIISELAEPGPEGENVLREVVTAVSFLAVPFGMMVTKYVDALFAISNEDIMTDASSVRTKSTLTFLIAYTGQLLSLWLLRSIPGHSDEVCERFKRAESSRGGAMLVTAALVFCLLWSAVVHLLSVFTASACLEFAGGQGC